MLEEIRISSRQGRLGDTEVSTTPILTEALSPGGYRLP